MSYPTEREVIRELIDSNKAKYEDGYKKGFYAGYDLGRATIINDINDIIKQSDDAFILLLALSNLLHKERNHD